LRSDVDENRWIWEKITGAVININNQFFNYDLTEIQSLQFTAYDSEEEGFYGKHIDMMYKSNGTRKLSLSVQLSEPEDYEGGSLMLYNGEEPMTLPKTRGTGLFFPSYSLHEVTPVTKGIRYSLVAWFLGPRFK
jgi:PKHD-type hydroxylase